MKQLFVWLAIILSAVLCVPTTYASKKSKPIVQLYGEGVGGSSVAIHTAYLILPDGSHALASCFFGPGTPPCGIEAFAAEKRVTVPCDLLKGDKKGVTCYRLESFYADRKNNDITLYTGKGKVTYHIDGPW